MGQSLSSGVRAAARSSSAVPTDLNNVISVRIRDPDARPGTGRTGRRDIDRLQDTCGQRFYNIPGFAVAPSRVSTKTRARGSRCRRPRACRAGSRPQGRHGSRVCSQAPSKTGCRGCGCATHDVGVSDRASRSSVARTENWSSGHASASFGRCRCCGPRSKPARWAFAACARISSGDRRPVPIMRCVRIPCATG